MVAQDAPERSVMDARQETFTAEEICEQAKGNAGNAILLVLVAARERGESLEEAARFVGRIFAPSWDEGRGKGALVVARSAALNAVTCGAQLRRLDGDTRRAEATIAGWPSEQDLAYFNLTQEEADALNGLYGPIAERLGLRYAWRRAGDEVTMAFEAMES
jgi:hypothetical protein